MDEKKKLISYRKKQRAKLLKKLQQTEPIAKQKEELKKAVEKAIEEQERVKSKVSEKRQEQIDLFKQLREAYPEYTDEQFNEFARKQLGLDIPRTLIEKLDEPKRKIALQKKASQRTEQPIIVEKPDPKKQAEILKQQEKQAKEIQTAKAIKEDINKKNRIDEIKQKLNELESIHGKQADLIKKYNTGTRQGTRPGSSKAALFDMIDLMNELNILEPKKPKSVVITKKILPNNPEFVLIGKIRNDIADFAKLPSKSQAKSKREEIKKEIATITNQAEKQQLLKDLDDAYNLFKSTVTPTPTPPTPVIPPATNITTTTKSLADLEAEILKEMNLLPGAADRADADDIMNKISNINSQIRLLDSARADIIDNEAKQGLQDWIDAEASAKASSTKPPSPTPSVFGFGLKRKLNKKNLFLYHIPHKMILDKGEEFILNKKGMERAGHLAKILHPKDFEKMLKFSIINHIRANPK